MSSTDVLLAAKLDTNDPLSVTLEMEPSHGEIKRYNNNCSQFRQSIKGMRCNLKCATIGLVSLMLVVILIGLLKCGFTSSPPPPTYSFALKEDLEDLQLLVNYSLNVVQQLKDGEKQSHIHVEQLQKEISDARNQWKSSQSIQESRAKSTSDQLSKLQRYIDHLNEEIHQPVNLYKRCKTDTKNCSINPQKSRDYWRDCATLSLPLNEEVYTIYYKHLRGELSFQLIAGMADFRLSM